MLTVTESLRARAAAVIAALLLVFCGHQAGERAGTTGGGGSGGFAAGAGASGAAGASGNGGATDSGLEESASGYDADSPKFYDGPKYDGDTSCTPDGSPFERRTCCEGKPCLGRCELRDGTWQCRCLGARGGCEPYGMVCCGSGCNSECWSPGV